MARISFKQGIIRHQTDTNNNPTFLQKVGNYVNLVISQDLTIITFVHGTKSYLFTESVTQESAWGPFSTGIDYWLYWDINRVTGIRTFGHTGYEPVTSSVAPVSPQTGQMWFDTTKNLMYEYNGASWVEVIRVFACKLEGGINFVSMSIDAPLFTGTQVGLTSTSNIGSLVFDSTGKPIFNGFGKFFTTEDIFTTGVPTGASLKINNILIRAQAQQPIASYHVVMFSDYNKIIPAEPFTYVNKVYGFLEEDVVTNEVVNIVTEGVIFNEAWDWPNDGGNVNDALYIDNAGQISLTPSIPGQIPVGSVIGPQSMLFSPGLYGIDSQDVITAHGALSGLLNDDHPQYFTLERGDTRYYEKTIANATFAPIVHTHVKSDITDFAHTHSEDVKVAGDTMTGYLTLNADPTTALHAVTKQYVDTLFSTGIKWIEPIITSTFKGEVNDPSIFTPTADYDTYIVGPAPAGDFSAFAPGTLVTYNGSGWTDILPSGPVQLGDRLGVAMHPYQYPPVNVDPSVSALLGKIITITNNTPGNLTWDEITPEETDAVFLKNENSPHFGHSYTFSGTWGSGTYGTEYFWIEFQTGVDYVNGTNIDIVGKTINVSPQGPSSGLNADLWDDMQSSVLNPVTGETLVYNNGIGLWENGFPNKISNNNNVLVSTIDVANGLLIQSDITELHGDSSSIAAELRLFEASVSGTNYVTVKAPSTLTSNVNFVLPTNNGTNLQYLQTDGAGNTSWVDVVSGNTSCIIDTDNDTFISVGYNGTPCTDTGNNVLQLQTGANASEDTGTINILSGNNTNAGFGSGAVNLSTGTPGYNGNSGNVKLNTGVVGNGNSGTIDIYTGLSPEAGNTGAIRINTGASDTSTGNTGYINILSGNTSIGSSGSILLASGTMGNSSAGPVYGNSTGSVRIESGVGVSYANGASNQLSGNLSILTGDTQIVDSGFSNTSGTSGNIKIGTGNVTGKYNIGKSGDLLISTGKGTGSKANQDSGAITIETGDTGYSGGIAGDILLKSGRGSSTYGSDYAKSGNIKIFCGNVYGSSGNAGNIEITSGSVQNGTSTGYAGSVLIKTGRYLNGGIYGGQPGKIDLITDAYASGVSGNITLTSVSGLQSTTTVDGGNIDLIPGNTNDSITDQANVRLFRSSATAQVVPEFRFQTATRTSADLDKYVAIRAPLTLTTGPNYSITLPENDAAMEDGTMLVSNALGDLQFQQAPYDINVQGFGTLNNGDIIGRFMVPRNITLKATGHIGLAQTAPVATDATFTVYASTGAGALTAIGTIVFAAGSQTVTSASFTTDRAFVTGDVITVECTTASSIADVTITLLGKLSFN